MALAFLPLAQDVLAQARGGPPGGGTPPGTEQPPEVLQCVSIEGGDPQLATQEQINDALALGQDVDVLSAKDCEAA